MNIPQLRTLTAIAEHKSFAVAAEALFLTPAAVSQQMRALEDELQVALFDRTTRPPRLNAHGVHIAERAHGVLRSFDALHDEARSADEVAGRLDLGCINGVSSDLVPTALRNLRKRYPRLQVRIEERQSGPLTRQVRRRELDAAIITEPLVPEPDLEMLPVTSEALVVVAPPDAEVSSWDAALVQLPFLKFSRTSGMGALIDHAIRSAGLIVNEAMELDSSEALLSMAYAGLGAGVIPAGQLKGTACASVQTFPFGDPPLSRRVVLIEQLDNARSYLSDVLYQELKRLTAGDNGTGSPPRSST